MSQNVETEATGETGQNKISVNEISPVLREIRCEIPWETVQLQINRRYGEIKRMARPIKGFRKGKVPRWLLEQMYGPQVTIEVTQKLISDALTQAMIENEFAPVATPDIEPEEFQKGRPLAFRAKVEVRPRLADITYDGLELKRTVSEVTNEDVDAEVERLRQEHAPLRSPDPQRPAREGDSLILDTEVWLDGKDEPDRRQEDHEVELGRGMLLEQIETALVGAEVGDKKVIPISFPERPDQEESKRRGMTFHVTVKDIREKILAELDDEFAKDVSEHETLLELRLALRESLEKRASSVADNLVRDQLLDALCAANPVEVPPSLVQQQLEETQFEMARMLQLDMAKNPFTEEQVERMRGQAEQKVRVALLLTQIAQDAELEVTEEDIEERLREIAEQTDMPLPKVKAEFGKGDRIDQLHIAMIQQRVVDHILSKANIIDVPPEQQADSEAERETSEEGEKDE